MNYKAVQKKEHLRAEVSHRGCWNGEGEIDEKCEQSAEATYQTCIIDARKFRHPCPQNLCGVLVIHLDHIQETLKM